MMGEGDNAAARAGVAGAGVDGAATDAAGESNDKRPSPPANWLPGVDA